MIAPTSLTSSTASMHTVRLLREELSLLSEPGSHVGEIAKLMGKSKALVKVSTYLRVPAGSIG